MSKSNEEILEALNESFRVAAEQRARLNQQLAQAEPTYKLYLMDVNPRSPEPESRVRISSPINEDLMTDDEELITLEFVEVKDLATSAPPPSPT